MAQTTTTAEDLLRDIYEADTAQRWFEQKYGLLSETFYRLYQQGCCVTKTLPKSGNTWNGLAGARFTRIVGIVMMRSFSNGLTRSPLQPPCST